MLASLLLIRALLAPGPVLPDPVGMELKRIDETYRVLDFVAQRVWPGWDDYRSTPFLLEYQNGLRVLIRHPKPPSEFVLVPGVTVETKAVYADFTHVSAQPITGLQRAAGGQTLLGQDSDGKPVAVIAMRFGPPVSADEYGIGKRTEQQMLVYIHELFHRFQFTRLKPKMYGSLRYNADASYAAYSEIEGLALERALGAGGDAALTRQYLGDFIAARKKKHAETMSELQANQERWGEFMEGGATYAELRTIELLQTGGFEPKLTEDAGYSGFRDPAALTKVYADYMKKALSDSKRIDARFYYCGAYQALLLDRLFPGWQKQGGFFDQEIERRLPASAVERLESEYKIAEITKRHSAEFEARDNAYRVIKSRSGRVYIVDFKKINQQVSSVAKPPKEYQLGMTLLWPEGAGPISFDEVEVSGLSVPSMSEQAFYIRAVDTAAPEEKAWSIEGEAQPDGTYRRAVVRTPVFTVKAPHVRVLDTKEWVKIQVLARVGENSHSSR